MTNDNPIDLIPVRALNQVSYCPRLRSRFGSVRKWKNT